MPGARWVSRGRGWVPNFGRQVQIYLKSKFQFSGGRGRRVGFQPLMLSPNLPKTQISKICRRWEGEVVDQTIYVES